jgi:hypothetical protein
MSGMARPSSGTARGHAGRARDGLRVADAIRSVPFAARCPQLVDAREVDEVLEAREPQREHRHEALPAGEHLRVVAVLAEQRDDLGHDSGAW